ncbi:putative Pentatricopeptide repeat-containing protein [Melia azedarach]|uniref:Pentatricopeptide repeat-containing protein n=1 Tax=Melia azedarach TaxID=155640 RepID=A0ACC1XY49_MELAZ|nr:putative Pentatricopeptide repeat-containing protein [Melia azedarach]
MPFPANLLSSKLRILSLRVKELSCNGKWQEVFSHYLQVKKAGFDVTDPSVFPLIIKACSNLSYTHGKSTHACLIKQGFESFPSIGNALMDFYVKWRFRDSAITLFDYVDSRDSVSWNIIIHGHLDDGALAEGLWWFNKARVSGFEPNTSVLVLVIQAYRSLGAYWEGLEVHGYIVRRGFWAVHSVQNSLLSMYVNTDMECARKMFDEMCERDVVSWSVMIGGYVRSEEAFSGLQLFREMVSDVRNKPDGLTLVSILKGCTILRDLSMGRLLHGFAIRRGLDCDLFVGNSLIDMYCKFNDADSTSKVFNEMPQKNKVSWNSALSGLVFNERYSEALSLLYAMRKEVSGVDEITLVNILQLCKYFVHPTECKSVHCVVLRQTYELNELVLNSLIDAYAKCHLIELAWKLFCGMKRRDVVLWSTMISGFTRCGMPDEAIAVFQQMNQAQEEKPNSVTIINLLEACSVAAELGRSKWAHGIAIRRSLATEVSIGTAIVDMYSKCGAIDASRKAFHQISEKNIVSWTAMVAAYGMNGLAHEALALVAEMKLHGLHANAVTVLSVLSACSHGGLVEEGLSFFKSMVQDHEVQPTLEHYSCIIDMLARAGKLDMALDLINKIPDKLKAGAASAWGAILSACRSYGNRELGEGAVSRILELEPQNSAGYLLASGMYAADGLWVDAARMRWLAKERGVKVIAGYSLVHVDNKACKFIAGEKSQFHPLASETKITVEQIHNCMKIDERNEILGSFE